jgi:hypothetical protein
VERLQLVSTSTEPRGNAPAPARRFRPLTTVCQN